MTVATTNRSASVDAVLVDLSVDEARRLTERIRLTAHTFAESRAKLIELVERAKTGNAHLALGYASWTAYLSEVLGSEPLRLARDDRKEFVAILSAEGMSTRAIAPIVGVNKDTVAEDLKPTGGNPPVERPATVTSLDGHQRPATQPAQKPRRNSLPKQAHNAGWELRKSVERLQRLAIDDRFDTNKEAVAPQLRGHLINAIEVCQDLLDRIND